MAVGAAVGRAPVWDGPTRGGWFNTQKQIARRAGEVAAAVSAAPAACPPVLTAAAAASAPVSTAAGSTSAAMGGALALRCLRRSLAVIFRMRAA